MNGERTESATNEPKRGCKLKRVTSHIGSDFSNDPPYLLLLIGLDLLLLGRQVLNVASNNYVDNYINCFKHGKWINNKTFGVGS